MICFFGRTTTAPWAFLLLYSCGPRSMCLVLAGDDDLVVEPAELQLVPGAEVGTVQADALVALGADPALGHDRPPVHRVLAGAGPRCRSGPADRGRGRTRGRRRSSRRSRAGSCSHPPTGRCCRPGRRRACCCAGPDGGVLEGVPAVAPDRVLALLLVTVGLVATGVDDLEVVDVAVGLVEVAVAVVVVAVPLVVRRQVGLDLRVGAALGLLVGDPRDRARPRSGTRCWCRRCRRTGSRCCGRSGPRCTGP